MVDFAHITPTAYLDLFASNRSYHLTLAHLVEQDDAYAAWYAKLKDNNVYDFVNIMDNSAFEMYKQGRPMYSRDKLIDMGKKVRANYIAMSDYPNDSPFKTINAALELAPSFRQEGFGTFFIPQSEIGNLDGLIESFRWAASAEEVDYIGVSILAVPNAYGVERGNKLQRFLSRWKFMHELQINGILDDIYRNDKKLHFLGMVDGPNEILLVKPWLKYINTWDSSAAVWAGLNGIEFDKSPSGLIDGKFEAEVHFDHRFAVVEDLCRAQRNINFIDEAINYAESI